MTNNVSDIIQLLASQDAITLQDALNALLNYIHRYQSLFDRMLNIQANMPVQSTDSGFRRQRFTQSHQYQDIQKLLQKFQTYLIKFEREQA